MTVKNAIEIKIKVTNMYNMTLKIKVSNIKYQLGG